jgi:hypothetical protein
MKKFRVKAFYGNILPENSLEIIVEARDETSAIFWAMLDINFANFSNSNMRSFEFVEAVEVM